MGRTLFALMIAAAWMPATARAQSPNGQPPPVVAQAPATVPPAPPVPAPPPGTPAPDVAPDAAAGEPPEPEGERPLAEDEAMVLNFERADIREVIHSLATALGISYTIDPRIEGQVTIRTTGRIARDDLFPLFNQILRNNGIAAVKVGDVYQILPVSEAKTRAIIPAGPTRLGLKQTDSFVIEIVALKHVSADEMSNILQPFLTPGGDVLSYPRANTLVITDINSNIARLRELTQTFDTDAFSSLHARVFKMKHGDPEELANELLGLLAPYGITATGDGEGGMYLIPLTRLNAIVVVSYDKSLFEEIEHWLKVLDTVAEKSDWGKPLPKGKGRGIAICDNMGSLCAHVAEITVSSKGELKVDRVTVAVDPHYVVNPLTIAEQMEGGTIFGLSAALYGKITVKNGVPEQGNFDTYRMVRLAEAPKIDVHIVPSGGPAWGGVGEASTPPIMAAVANAIFAVTGKRIRSLPIMDHDLSSGSA